MAKHCSTIILNAACTVIRDNCTLVTICTSDITTASSASQANSTANYMLASATLTTGASTSWTIAAGDVSGVKITMSSQSTLAVEKTGVAQKICLMAAGSSKIYNQTECTTQNLASTANRVTIPAFDIEFRDAT